MSRGGNISLDFAGGEHDFALRLGELRELEDRCGAGTGAIWRRCMSGDWRVMEVREIIRLGLIGGGMEAGRALALVRRYVDEGRWAESHMIALAVLGAALSGPELEGEGGEKTENPPRRAKGKKHPASPSPASMAMAQ